MDIKDQNKNLQAEQTEQQAKRTPRVYIASSWRNELQPLIVALCRELGFDVYDFKNPPNGTGFGWKSCNRQIGLTPDFPFEQWNFHQYRNALSTPTAQAAFDSDMSALQAADVCILVWPAGVSAALEFGYAVGAGKSTYVIGQPREPELMVLMAGLYANSLQGLRTALSKFINTWRKDQTKTLTQSAGWESAQCDLS